MMITKQTVADKIAAYLHHEITLAQLVDWAEQAMMDGEFAECDARTISPVIARLGVADVRAFGLAWEDCEELLHTLGFSPRVEVIAVSGFMLAHRGRTPARGKHAPRYDPSARKESRILE